MAKNSKHRHQPVESLTRDLEAKVEETMDKLWEDLAPKALSSSGESVTRRKRTDQVLVALQEKIGGEPPRKKQKSGAIKANEELSAPAMPAVAWSKAQPISI